MDEPDTPESETLDDLQDADFQLALKELLAAYQPILKEELERTSSPQKLADEAARVPPNCDDELKLADRLFERFLSDKVMIALLPPQARELLGPLERWRWCLLHIRCCVRFGWLVCRGPRTFRGFSYYLYRYWRCVREAVGNPVGEVLTSDERQDFQTLVQALAGAFKPYLTDQLASVEFPLGVPDEVLSGKIDCFEGEEDAAAIFERLLTPQTAEALLGKAAFERHSKDAFFWFCRCWCLCAIRFGCCLARARSLVEVVRCLRAYRRCLRECFRPLTCELLKPTGCTEEEALGPAIGGGLGISVFGTATGASFSHYTIEWRKVEGQACDDNADWKTDGVHYPGGGPTGNSTVSNGTLAQINTTVWGAGSYEIRVCVYSTQGLTRRCCCIQFNLFKKLVFISHVAGMPVKSPPGPFISTAPIVDGTGTVVPVGCCITVKGSAFVGDCNNRKIKCFDLRYGLGFLPGPGEFGFNPVAYFGSFLAPLGGPVCYTPPDEADKRAPWNQLIGRPLTTRFAQVEIDLGGGSILKTWKLADSCVDSASALPPCPDPQHGCRSGKYTLLLDVEDTLGNHYYDTQHVWFDNKPIHAEFNGLQGLPSCADLNLSKFVPGGAPCAMPWPIDAMGLAYDEYIDAMDLSYPSDNFDYYSLSITRQGGPTYTVPISLVLPPVGPVSTLGRNRVGDPGTRCEESLGCPAPVHPPKFDGVLTKIDLRAFDLGCASSLPAAFAPPAGFALKRGECCGYSFQLYAQDKTVSDGGAGVCHRIWTPPWAVCICNDLSEG